MFFPQNDFWYCFCRGCAFIFQSIDVYLSLLSALASVHCSSGFACILNSRAICGCKGGAQPVHLDPCIHILLCYDAQQQTTISVQKPEHRRSERITVFMLRKKSPKGDLGGILFFPYSASGLPGLFIWKVLALASILKAPNYSVIISNFIKIFFLKTARRILVTLVMS